MTSATWISNSIILSLCFLTFTQWCTDAVEISARLINPPPRNIFSSHSQGDKLNCGGIKRQWLRNKGKCGLCGEPYDSSRPNADGGKYARGVIGMTYKAGSYFQVTSKLPYKSAGYIEIRLCKTHKHKVTCFKKLIIQDSMTTRFVTKKHEDHVILTLKIPENIVCEHCILQWKFVLDNEKCPKCKERMTFINCADVSIQPGGLVRRKRQISQQTPNVQPAFEKPSIKTVTYGESLRKQNAWSGPAASSGAHHWQKSQVNKASSTNSNNAYTPEVKSGQNIQHNPVHKWTGSQPNHEPAQQNQQQLPKEQKPNNHHTHVSTSQQTTGQQIHKTDKQTTYQQPNNQHTHVSTSQQTAGPQIQIHKTDKQTNYQQPSNQHTQVSTSQQTAGPQIHKTDKKTTYQQPKNQHAQHVTLSQQTLGLEMHKIEKQHTMYEQPIIQHTQQMSPLQHTRGQQIHNVDKQTTYQQPHNQHTMHMSLSQQPTGQEMHKFDKQQTTHQQVNPSQQQMQQGQKQSPSTPHKEPISLVKLQWQTTGQQHRQLSNPHQPQQTNQQKQQHQQQFLGQRQTQSNQNKQQPQQPNVNMYQQQSLSQQQTQEPNHIHKHQQQSLGQQQSQQPIQSRQQKQPNHMHKQQPHSLGQQLSQQPTPKRQQQQQPNHMHKNQQQSLGQGQIQQTNNIYKHQQQSRNQQQIKHQNRNIQQTQQPNHIHKHPTQSHSQQQTQQPNHIHKHPTQSVSQQQTQQQNHIHKHPTQYLSQQQTQQPNHIQKHPTLSLSQQQTQQPNHIHKHPTQSLSQQQTQQPNHIQKHPKLSLSQHQTQQQNHIHKQPTQSLSQQQTQQQNHIHKHPTQSLSQQQIQNQNGLQQKEPNTVHINQQQSLTPQRTQQPKHKDKYQQQAQLPYKNRQHQQPINQQHRQASFSHNRPQQTPSLQHQKQSPYYNGHQLSLTKHTSKPNSHKQHNKPGHQVHTATSLSKQLSNPIQQQRPQQSVSQQPNQQHMNQQKPSSQLSQKPMIQQIPNQLSLYKGPSKPAYHQKTQYHQPNQNYQPNQHQEPNQHQQPNQHHKQQQQPFVQQNQNRKTRQQFGSLNPQSSYTQEQQRPQNRLGVHFTGSLSGIKPTSNRKEPLKEYNQFHSANSLSAMAPRNNMKPSDGIQNIVSNSMSNLLAPRDIIPTSGGHRNVLSGNSGNIIHGYMSNRLSKKAPQVVQTSKPILLPDLQFVVDPGVTKQRIGGHSRPANGINSLTTQAKASSGVANKPQPPLPTVRRGSEPSSHGGGYDPHTGRWVSRGPTGPASAPVPTSAFRFNQRSAGGLSLSVNPAPSSNAIANKPFVSSKPIISSSHRNVPHLAVSKNKNTVYQIQQEPAQTVVDPTLNQQTSAAQRNVNGRINTYQSNQNVRTVTSKQFGTEPSLPHSVNTAQAGSLSKGYAPGTTQGNNDNMLIENIKLSMNMLEKIGYQKADSPLFVVKSKAALPIVRKTLETKTTVTKQEKPAKKPSPEPSKIKDKMLNIEYDTGFKLSNSPLYVIPSKPAVKTGGNRIHPGPHKPSQQHISPATVPQPNKAIVHGQPHANMAHTHSQTNSQVSSGASGQMGAITPSQKQHVATGHQSHTQMKPPQHIHSSSRGPAFSLPVVHQPQISQVQTQHGHGGRQPLKASTPVHQPPYRNFQQQRAIPQTQGTGTQPVSQTQTSSYTPVSQEPRHSPSTPEQGSTMGGAVSKPNAAQEQVKPKQQNVFDASKFPGLSPLPNNNNVIWSATASAPIASIRNSNSQANMPTAKQEPQQQPVSQNRPSNPSKPEPVPSQIEPYVPTVYQKGPRKIVRVTVGGTQTFSYAAKKAGTASRNTFSAKHMFKYLHKPHQQTVNKSPQRAQQPPTQRTSGQVSQTPTGQEPHASTGQVPHASTGQGPHASTGQGPPASTGQGPHASTGQGPHVSTGQGPHASLYEGNTIQRKNIVMPNPTHNHGGPTAKNTNPTFGAVPSGLSGNTVPAGKRGIISNSLTATDRNMNIVNPPNNVNVPPKQTVNQNMQGNYVMAQEHARQQTSPQGSNNVYTPVDNVRQQQYVNQDLRNIDSMRSDKVQQQPRQTDSVSRLPTNQQESSNIVNRPNNNNAPQQPQQQYVRNTVPQQQYNPNLQNKNVIPSNPTHQHTSSLNPGSTAQQRYVDRDMQNNEAMVLSSTYQQPSPQGSGISGQPYQQHSNQHGQHTHGRNEMSPNPIHQQASSLSAGNNLPKTRQPSGNTMNNKNVRQQEYVNPSIPNNNPMSSDPTQHQSTSQGSGTNNAPTHKYVHHHMQNQNAKSLNPTQPQTSSRKSPGSPQTSENIVKPVTGNNQQQQYFNNNEPQQQYFNPNIQETYAKPSDPTQRHASQPGPSNTATPSNSGNIHPQQYTSQNMQNNNPMSTDPAKHQPSRLGSGNIVSASIDSNIPQQQQQQQYVDPNMQNSNAMSPNPNRQQPSTLGSSNNYVPTQQHVNQHPEHTHSNGAMSSNPTEHRPSSLSSSSTNVHNQRYTNQNTHGHPSSLGKILQGTHQETKPHLPPNTASVKDSSPATVNGGHHNGHHTHSHSISSGTPVVNSNSPTQMGQAGSSSITAHQKTQSTVAATKYIPNSQPTAKHTTVHENFSFEQFRSNFKPLSFSNFKYPRSINQNVNNQSVR